jgi:hypothetical protein
VRRKTDAEMLEVRVESATQIMRASYIYSHVTLHLFGSDAFFVDCDTRACSINISVLHYM